jgi:prevent-host-death family protein
MRWSYNGFKAALAYPALSVLVKPLTRRRLGMREQQPPTETMKISDVKTQLSRLVDRVSRNETRVLLEKAGVPVAAIVSADDLARLARMDRERAERFKILDEFGEAFADVPVEELEREVERALRQVRAEAAMATDEPAVAERRPA